MIAVRAHTLCGDWLVPCGQGLRNLIGHPKQYLDTKLHRIPNNFLAICHNLWGSLAMQENPRTASSSGIIRFPAGHKHSPRSRNSIAGCCKPNPWGIYPSMLVGLHPPYNPINKVRGSAAFAFFVPPPPWPRQGIVNVSACRAIASRHTENQMFIDGGRCVVAKMPP